ncbi:MAG: hypothetical protein ACTS6O_11955, partial [Giesbergeria sp.]
CAERAFFAQVPLAHLPAYPDAAALPRPDAHGYVLCFATQAIGNTAVRGLHSTELLATEQSRWAHADATIAFDEGACNSDRHVFNLVRRAANDYVLIDHGYLLRTVGDPHYPAYWADGAIEGLTAHAFSNVLHRNSYPAIGRNAPGVCLDGCGRSLVFCQKLRHALHHSLFEIAYWSSLLRPGCSARWLHFLRSRMEQGQMAELLHKRFGLVHFHDHPTV